MERLRRDESKLGRQSRHHDVGGVVKSHAGPVSLFYCLYLKRSPRKHARPAQKGNRAYQADRKTAAARKSGTSAIVSRSGELSIVRFG